jgi:uncharacterized protein (TIGR03086 family)
MSINTQSRLHHRALDDASAAVARADDLDRATPCAGWNLGRLLAHMVGQNFGFADAVELPTVGVDAFAERPPTEWAASVQRVTDAFAAAPEDRLVLLPEISPTNPFRVSVVVGFHLLDSVVHAWDVAASIGLPYRPDDELLAETARWARRVPTGDARRAPGAAFGPELTATGDHWADKWAGTLALLGRDPSRWAISARD